MLTIRLTRKGKKNQPFFKMVVVDKRRSSKAGKFLEDLGFIDPLTKRKSLNKERIKYWLSKGAKPSDRAHNLFVTEKIIEGQKVNVSKLGKKRRDKISADKKEADDKAKAEAEAPKGAEAEKPAEQPKEEPKAEKPAETPKEEKPAEPVAEKPKEESKAEKLVEAPKEEVEKEIKPAETPKEEKKPEEKKAT